MVLDDPAEIRIPLDDVTPYDKAKPEKRKKNHTYRSKINDTPDVESESKYQNIDLSFGMMNCLLVFD